MDSPAGASALALFGSATAATAAASAPSVSAASAGHVAWRVVQLSGFPDPDHGAFNQPVGAIDDYLVPIRDAAENVG
jgi:hypothetical protein